MAAGQGTRMRSATPKVLHDLCGRPLIAWPVTAALESGASKVVVVGGPDRVLARALPDRVGLAVQEQPRGTGDAVRAAADHLDPSAPVIVLSGDVPLVTAELIRELTEVHVLAEAAATMVTMELDDPTGYGRVVRGADGNVERVVETKAEGEATAEQLAIREVNAGVYAFEPDAMLEALAALEPEVAATGHGIPLRGEAMRAGLRALARDFDRLAVPAHGRYVGRPALTDARGVVAVPPDVAHPLPRLLLGFGAGVVAGLALQALLPPKAGRRGPRSVRSWSREVLAR
jgi:CTP:molybdopterin cytidylyltransferase MocA